MYLTLTLSFIYVTSVKRCNVLKFLLRFLSLESRKCCVPFCNLDCAALKECCQNSLCGCEEAVVQQWTVKA